MSKKECDVIKTQNELLQILIKKDLTWEVRSAIIDVLGDWVNDKLK